MATRALILASEPIDLVFQNLLESITEAGGTIGSIDDKRYYLEGKTPSFRHHNVSDFKITLSVKKFGTLISILDEVKGERNRKFINPIIDSLHNRFFVCHQVEEVKELNSYNACSNCGKEVSTLQFKSRKLCFACLFGDMIGKVLLVSSATYYGGHKAYLAGGAFSDSQLGKLYLTDHYVIFVKADNDPSKRWEIIIPLISVNIEQWGIEEKARLKHITGVGGGFGDGGGIGTGLIHETGKEHHLIIAYTDENRIPQQPRFGLVATNEGTPIRQWAESVYRAVVSSKKDTNVSGSIANSDGKTNEDPLHILKIRFVKGEITKEEYDEMRKVVEP